MLRRTCVLLVACSGLAASGCGAAFTHPLSDADSSVVDERLLGRWIKVDANANETPTGDGTTILRDDAAPNVLRFDSGGMSKTTKKPDYFRLYCTKIGDRHVLSILPPHEEEEAYAVAAYDFIDDDTLRLSGPSLSLLEQAIKDAKLQGKVDEGGAFRPKNVRITSEADAVRTFIEENAATFFEPINEFTLRRVPD
jgi:hypothetical protein